MSRVPSNIGRYSIVEVIGHGGMGALYLAWDPKLERQIAIKVLKEDIDELRERFAREARSAARLRHPHIVTIFELGEHEGQPYIAMEYIRGRTLAQIIRDGEDMPLGRTLEWMAALSDGLAFAHKAGIIHRDVKPANIMVDEQGSLKILDFGIARLAESAGFTQTGMMMGTLNYMSPEQVSGGNVDHRSDIFAVGLVFYELLTKKEAFPGTVSTGLLGKLMHSEPTPLAQVCPGLDGEVVRIVGRAIEKDIGRRYQNLTEMRREILTVLRRLSASERLTPVVDTPLVVPGAPGSQPGPPPPVAVTPIPVTSAPEMPPVKPESERRASERSAIAQRRASQIQLYLDEAEREIAQARYDAAIVACEHVLMLDAENARALDLVDRARAAAQALRTKDLLEQDELGKELERQPSIGEPAPPPPAVHASSSRAGRYGAIAAGGLGVLLLAGYWFGPFRPAAPDTTTPKTQPATPVQREASIPTPTPISTPTPTPTPTLASTPTPTQTPESTPETAPAQTPAPAVTEGARRQSPVTQPKPAAAGPKSKTAPPVAPEMPRSEQPGRTNPPGPSKTPTPDRPAAVPPQSQTEQKPSDDESAITALLGRLGRVLSTTTNSSRNINDVLAVWPSAGRNVFGDNEMQQYRFSNPVFVNRTAEAASVDCLRDGLVLPRSATKTSGFQDSVRIELRKTKAGWQVMSITPR